MAVQQISAVKVLTKTLLGSLGMVEFYEEVSWTLFAR
jgi:hypothetical protein